MAINKRTFHYHERGNHNEKWYHLVQDSGSGEVYVEHEWDEPGDHGSRRIEISDFLSEMSHTGQSKLLTLIGSLASEGRNA